MTVIIKNSRIKIRSYYIIKSKVIHHYFYKKIIKIHLFNNEYVPEVDTLISKLKNHLAFQFPQLFDLLKKAANFTG